MYMVGKLKFPLEKQTSQPSLVLQQCTGSVLWLLAGPRKCNINWPWPIKCDILVGFPESSHMVLIGIKYILKSGSNV